MSNVVPLRPTDPVDEYVKRIETRIGHPLDPELRATFVKYMALPRVQLTAYIPGGERLTDDERKSIQLWLRKVIAEYGELCILPLLVELMTVKSKFLKLSQK